MSEHQKIWFLREAGHVTRNHIWPTIRQQVVGHHSYNAVQIYLTYCPQPKIVVVRELLNHDTGERGAGDMPATAKWADKELNSRYANFENKVRKRFGVEEQINEAEDLMWLLACDKIEFAMFCLEEMALGNRYAESRHQIVMKSLEEQDWTGNLPEPLAPLVYELRDSKLPVMINDKDLANVGK